MDIQLRKNVHIRTISFDATVRCAWSGDETDGPFIEITTPEKPNNRVFALAQIDVHYAGRLASVLDEFDPNGYEGQREKIGYNIKHSKFVHTKNSEGIYCPICEESCTGMESYILNLATIHNECIDEVVTVLDNLWENHNDEILKQQFEE